MGWFSLSLSLFFKDFIFLRDRERVREELEWKGGAEGEGEADSPPSREPDAGLNPRTPGS